MAALACMDLCSGYKYEELSIWGVAEEITVMQKVTSRTVKIRIIWTIGNLIITEHQQCPGTFRFCFGYMTLLIS